MQSYLNRNKLNKRQGIVGVSLLAYFLIFLTLLVGVDLVYIFLSEKCINTGVIECLFNSAEEEVQEEVELIEATGSFGYKDYSVSVSLIIPLEGGKITGSATGDCSGSIVGTYEGGAGGAISGEGKGSCAIFFPASGTFSGTVDANTKTVPIEGTGNLAGYSGSGSITLSY